MRRIAPWLLGALLCTDAHAFCGAYVGTGDEPLYNRASTVVLARVGHTTTLTFANDYEGDPSEFALVVPVPPTLTAEGVRVLSDPAALEALDQWSVPRVAAYTCDDAFVHSHWPTTQGCGLMVGCSDYAVVRSTADGADAADAVNVEASFAVAEYDVSIVSSEGAEGLQAWLDANGYAFPAGGEAIVQEYLDAGSWFLAAKVALDRTSGDWLSPIQLAYEAVTMSVPLKIGTISSAGEQDLVLLVLAESEVGIANYPQVTMEADCMWRGEADTSFGAWYVEQVDAAIAEQGVGWVREYSWPTATKCDPCPDGVQTVDPELLAELGAAGVAGLDTGRWSSAQLTRLAMRYGPDDVEQDLVLYETGHSSQEQLRYLQYDRKLEFLLPICGEGYVEDPGDCWSEVDRSGVALPGGLLGATWTLLLALFRRRQR